MSKNNASILAVMGASGSGKSLYIKRGLKRSRPGRLLIWDPLREYGEFGLVHDAMGSMVDAMAKAGKSGRFSLVFQPAVNEKQRAKQFDLFCGLALAAGNLTVIIEELKFVTRPSFAPLRWSEITLTGRHKGLRVVGVSQRPASIDKDFLGNATVIHCGRLAYPEDRRAVAKAAGIDETKIEQLLPLEYIEKNMATGEISTGKVRV